MQSVVYIFAMLHHFPIHTNERPDKTTLWFPINLRGHQSKNCFFQNWLQNDRNKEIRYLDSGQRGQDEYDRRKVDYYNRQDQFNSQQQSNRYPSPYEQQRPQPQPQPQPTSQRVGLYGRDDDSPYLVVPMNGVKGDCKGDNCCFPKCYAEKGNRVSACTCTERHRLSGSLVAGPTGYPRTDRTERTTRFSRNGRLAGFKRRQRWAWTTGADWIERRSRENGHAWFSGSKWSWRFARHVRNPGS